jgi:hypothetical protein
VTRASLAIVERAIFAAFKSSPESLLVLDATTAQSFAYSGMNNLAFS